MAVEKQQSRSPGWKRNADGHLVERERQFVEKQQSRSPGWKPFGHHGQKANFLGGKTTIPLAGMETP